jgi:hypothetical protein
MAFWEGRNFDARTAKYGTYRDGADGSCNSFSVTLNHTTNTDNEKFNFELASPLYDVNITKPYILSACFKFLDPNAATISLQCNQYDTDIIVSVAEEIGYNWTKISVVFEPTLSFCELVLIFSLNGADQNTFYVDQIQLVQVPSVTTLPGTTLTASSTETSTLSRLSSTPGDITTISKTVVGTTFTTVVSATTTGYGS